MLDDDNQIDHQDAVKRHPLIVATRGQPLKLATRSPPVTYRFQTKYPDPGMLCVTLIITPLINDVYRKLNQHTNRIQRVHEHEGGI